MSRENVEIDQATFKAWNAGDMDALRELYGPDIIMRARRVGRSLGLSSVGRRSCASWSRCARRGTPTPWN